MNSKVRDWISRLIQPSLVPWLKALPASWPSLVPIALSSPLAMIDRLANGLPHSSQPAELCILVP